LKNKKILFVLPNFSGGGAERVFINLSSFISKEKYLDVYILVFNNSGPLKEFLSEKVKIINLNRDSLRFSIFDLVKEIRLLKPDLIFSTFGYVNLAILIARPVLPKNSKIWIREANMPSVSLKKNRLHLLFKFLYLILYRTSNKIICSSLQMKNEFIKLFFINPEKISILYNPIDVKSIRGHIDQGKFKVNSDVLSFISVGRLTEQKAFDELIKLFSQIKQKNSTLKIFGDGNLKTMLNEIILSLGIENRVKIFPFTKNIWSHIAISDAFLSTSRWEGMPNSILESLASGTKVISSSSAGAVKEITNLCNKNNIVIFDNKECFLDEINKIKKKKCIEDSLLPDSFEIENVVKKFLGMIDEEV